MEGWVAKMSIAIYPGDSILLPIREQFPCCARQFLHPRLPSCGTVWPHSWEGAPTTTRWQRLWTDVTHASWDGKHCIPILELVQGEEAGRKGGSHGIPAMLSAQPVYKESTSTREIWRRESHPIDGSDALGIPLHCAINPTGNVLWLRHAVLQLGSKSILACFEDLFGTWHLDNLLAKYKVIRSWV